MNRILTFLVVGAFLLVRADAATWSVTNLQDSGPGSLRQAITDANAFPDADEITFRTAQGKISLETPLPAVVGPLTIIGPGSDSLAVSGGDQTQILSVGAGAQVEISGLTFAGGRAPLNVNGGAIVNLGSLTLHGCVLSGNRTSGGFGGAIANSGALVVTGSRLADNQAVGGASIGSGPKGALGGGGGGFGGAIYSDGGSLSIIECRFEGNSALGGSGREPQSADGAEGTAGKGGGPNAGVGGFSGQATSGATGGFGSGGGGGGNASAGDGGRGGSGGFGGGGGGAGGGTPTSGAPAPGAGGGAGGYGGGNGVTAGNSDSWGQQGGGGAGFGGAIFLTDTAAAIAKSLLLENAATGGIAGAYGRGAGAGGGSGMGGAVFIYSGGLTMEDCSLKGNTATGGEGGAGYNRGGTGGAAQGGGLTNYGGTVQIHRSTLAFNKLQGGKAGAGFRYGAAGGDASGGGAAFVGGTATVTNSTISRNTVTGGDGLAGSYVKGAGVTGISSGGGIASTSGSLAIVNCTVAQNVVQPGTSRNLYDPSYHDVRSVGARMGGGIYAAGGSRSILNSLFAGNHLKVVLDNTTEITETASDGHGTFSSLGHNLFETSAEVQGLTPGDLRDVPAPLYELADNGGPTLTHALTAENPARDAGRNDGAPATDQRGVSRPQASAADIGAFETSALMIQLDGQLFLGGTTMRSAPVQLTFQPAFSGGTIFFTLDGSQPTQASTRYTGPVTLSPPATIRAVTFNGDFSDSVEAGAVNLVFAPLPHTRIAFQSGDPVPGEPLGTTFVSFGNPTINDAGVLAFTASIRTSAGVFSAVFAGSGIVARAGSDAPQEYGELSPFKFEEFSDPVLDETGRVAFIATLQTSMRKELQGIWTNAGTYGLTRVALRGGRAPGLLFEEEPGLFSEERLAWTAFRSVSIEGGQLLFTGSLKRAKYYATVRAESDFGAWTKAARGPVIPLIREGTTQVSTPSGESEVRSVALFPPVAGALAQGGTHSATANGSPALRTRVTLADRKQALLRDDGAGNFQLSAPLVTGSAIEASPSLEGAVWASFGYPSLSRNGAAWGFSARMQPGSGGVTAANDAAVFVEPEGEGLALRVREGDAAIDSQGATIPGTSFASFGATLIGGSPVEFAFLGKLRGAGVRPQNDSGLWAGTSAGLRMVAREGEQAVETPVNARWSAFTSVVLGTERGPHFVANVTDGSSGGAPRRLRGLWGTDRAEQLRLLLQDGSTIVTGTDTRRVKSFTALAPAKGVEGTARGFSPSGALVAPRVTFDDRTEAILVISIP